MTRAIVSLPAAVVLAAGIGLLTHQPVSKRAAMAFGGQGETTTDTRIEPFIIDVSEEILTDLRERLRRARLPDEPEGVGWQLGMNQAYLRQLIAYWRDEFDWREQERRLNELEQFRTRIDGLDIHFVHRRSPEPDAFPLILTHGWPGTFAEFAKVIGPLTDPVAHGGRAEDAFPRRGAVDPRLRLFGSPAAAGLRARPDRRHLRRADGPAGIRAIHRAGW